MPYTFENDNELIADGDYEAVIERAEVKVIPTSGKEKFSVMFRIRNDVEQPCKNRVIFDDIWKSKNDPEHFNQKRINKILGTQAVKEGEAFETIDDIAKKMLGGYLIIHVGHEFDDYYGEDRNRIVWFAKTKNGAQKLGGEVPAPTSTPSKPKPKPEIDDEDLPF